MEMDHNDRIIYPELPKIRIIRGYLCKNTYKIIRTTAFIQNRRRTGLSESGLTEVYCICIPQISTSDPLFQDTLTETKKPDTEGR